VPSLFVPFVFSIRARERRRQEHFPAGLPSSAGDVIEASGPRCVTGALLVPRWSAHALLATIFTAARESRRCGVEKRRARRAPGSGVPAVARLRGRGRAGGIRGPEYRCTAVRRRMKFVLAVPSAPDTRVPRPCLHFPHFVILLVYARRGGANGRVEVRPMSVCSFFAASARVQRGKLRLGRARVPLGLSSSGVETDGIGLTRRKGQGRSIHLFVATRAGSARLPYESGAPTEYCDNAEFTQHCHGVPAFGAGAPARPVPAGRACGIKQLVPPPLCADWRRPLLRATA
jgi:hypothetical protein